MPSLRLARRKSNLFKNNENVNIIQGLNHFHMQYQEFYKKYQACNKTLHELYMNLILVYALSLSFQLLDSAVKIYGRFTGSLEPSSLTLHQFYKRPNQYATLVPISSMLVLFEHIYCITQFSAFPIFPCF